MFLFASFVIPDSLKLLHKAWMIFALLLSLLMTRLILVISFSLLIIPMNIILRLIGKDILNTKFDLKQDSYWGEYKKVEDKKRYTKMF